MSTKNSRVAAVGVAAGLVLSALPASSALAHSGWAGPYSSVSLCEEDRRKMTRAGHEATPCYFVNAWPAYFGWYFDYSH